MHTHGRMHAHIYTCMHACSHSHTFMYTYMYLCTQTRVYACTLHTRRDIFRYFFIINGYPIAVIFFKCCSGVWNVAT